MQELCGLLEERGVVLVALDHERCFALRAIAEREPRFADARRAKAAWKILGQSADQESWCESTRLQQVCRHGGGRSLAVSPSDDERRAAVEGELREGTRDVRVAQAALNGGHHFGVILAAHIADDGEIGRGLEVARVEPW